VEPRPHHADGGRGLRRAHRDGAPEDRVIAPPPRSLWLQEALAADTARAEPLRGDTRCDVCIVGGGFTGLWTAIRLKEADPALDVVLIERDVCGAGASGRNGGFVMSLWSKFTTLKKLCGAEEALRLCQASADAIHDLEHFCRDNQIDAGLRVDGWMWAATSAAQVGTWDATVDELARYQAHPFVPLDPAEVAARTGSPFHVAGVFEPSSASVQPAQLARGLRRVALERGVRIFEGTTMRGLSKTQPCRVQTGGGSVTAGQVVLATNAWGVAFAEIRKAIVVVSSDIVATDAAPDALARTGWTDGMTISDSRMLVHYYRTTPDGRVVFGRGGGRGGMAFGRHVGARFEGNSAIAGEVETWLRRTYPAHDGVPRTHSWRGPIDRSPSGLPMFGRLASYPGVLFGVGYSGNGVGPSMLGGRILASLALGRDDEWSRCGLVGRLTRGFPPEPIRFIGGNIVRYATERKDAAEDAGRKPSWLIGRLAGLAPAGLSPFKKPE
jgi:putative aminophosphonate oxidoreductase